MASLIQDSRGNYHSRKRIPDDCRAGYKTLYGQGHEAKFYAPASVGRAEAQRLFREWEAEVTGRFETIQRTQRGDGIDLNHKEATGLAGQWYLWFTKRHENEPGEPGGYWDAALDDLISDMRWHYAMHVDPDDPWKDEYGNTGTEIMLDPEVRKKMRPVIADLGHTAQFLAGRGIALTNKAKDLFLDCVLLNAVPALLRLEGNAGGDYSADELLKTFPAFDQNKAAQPVGLTPMGLFEVWVKYKQPKHSSISSWLTVFKALTKRFPDAAAITPDQAQQWIEGLITGKRSAGTVNKTWVRATKAVYAFGLRRHLVSSNPFKSVVVERQRRTELRPLHLYDDEIKTMLKAASAVTDTSTPDNAAKRWVVGLLAYTGARPSEVTQLRSQDVKQIDGIWCLDFNPEAGAIKTDEARAVPLHPHLIEQGFLEWAKHRNGPATP